MSALPEPNEIGRLHGVGSGFPSDLPRLRGDAGVDATGVEVISYALDRDAEPACIKSALRRSGTLTFGLPKPEGLASWLHTPAPRLPLVCFGAGKEFDGVSEGGFAAHTVSIGRAEFELLADDFGLRSSPDTGQPSVLDMEATPKAANHLSRKLEEFSRKMSDGAAREEEEELALALLLVTAQASTRRDASTTRMRNRVLRRALEIMDDRADAPPGMRELCVLCNTSLPTLQRAFLERFGMGPKAYLTALRMNRARQDLLARTHGNRVADAANRWGFWHMGQFAKDYRKIFNCLPSEDLDRGG